MFKSKFQFWWVAISLCLATLLTRAPITTLSTILNPVSTEYNLSATEQAVIISLPTFIMALGSAFVSHLDRKIGVVLSVFVGLLIIFIGFIVRTNLSQLPVFSIGFIYTGIFLTSLGLTILSVLYPAFINAFFKPQIAVMSSINSTNIALSALIGTLTATTLVSNGYSWRFVGELWVIITGFIILFYTPTIAFTKSRMRKLMFVAQKHHQNTKQGNIDYSSDAHMNMWTQLPAWLLAIGFGLQSTSFYYSISWFPLIISDFLNSTQISFLLNVYQFVSTPFALLPPIILVKWPKYTNLFMLVVSVVFGFTSIGMVVFTNYNLLFANLLTFGVCSALLISAFMTLIALKTTSHIATSKLSSMVQSMAYLLTSLFLLLFGVLKSYTGSYVPTMWIITIYSILYPLFALAGVIIPFKQNSKKTIV